MFRWTFTSILPTREECAAGVSEYDIGLLEKCVRKYTLLNPTRARSCPFCVRFVRYASCTRSDCPVHMFVCCPSLIRRHLACWTEAVRYIFFTGSFQPFHVRCMYVRSFGFSIGLTFLPPNNKNSYPFHIWRFNPVMCDRSLSNNILLLYYHAFHIQEEHVNMNKVSLFRYMKYIYTYEILYIS